MVRTSHNLRGTTYLHRRCKANNSSRQFHESAIGQHLLDNPVCASHYNDDKFSILARGRSLFHLSALEATFIKSLQTKRFRLFFETILNL